MYHIPTYAIIKITIIFLIFNYFKTTIKLDEIVDE